MYFIFVCIAVVALHIAAFVALPDSWLQRFNGANYRSNVPLPPKAFPFASVGLIVLCVLTLIGSFIAYPYVNVWQRGMAGQAQMAEAEANRQIKVREAQAEKDAATLLAEAEVIRAEGVKQANAIIADGLGGPSGYLRYLYIQGLKEADKSGAAKLIYVPTEAGLPITEANRLRGE
jgi:hypothetical protein